ncbi:MAG: FAD-binding oxidoreductase [Thermodesulfobacteriota bacterium]|nr:FAD-binding oxidoreductase [Thermodesulfobacteriota bacterium]
MKTMKEIIIGQMEKGPETLTEVMCNRKNGPDYRNERTRSDDIVGTIHPPVLNLIVSEILPATEGSSTIRLISKNGYLPPFEAGQYINIFVEIDGVRTSRPYSIASSARQRAYYDITVARIPSGFVSDHFIDKVKVGDRFQANGPAGQFRYVPVFHSKKQIYLAGGSGITPFMSMISETLDAGLDKDIHLIYGSRTKDAAIYHKELLDYAKKHTNFTYSLVLSEPEASWTGRTGFLDAACIKKLCPDVTARTSYICGPPIMNDFCVKALTELEVPKRMIRREMFGARQDIENEPGWPQKLTGQEKFKLTVGGKTVGALANESILTALERNNIPMNVCCRSGECSLCRVKLVSGTVFQPRGVLLRYADEKYGYIHSCKSYPISDVEIEL